LKKLDKINKIQVCKIIRLSYSENMIII